MKIKTKVFFSLLGISALLIILTIGLVQEVVKQGMQDYANQRQMEFLNTVATRIADSEYSLEALAASPKKLKNLWREQRERDNGEGFKKNKRGIPPIILQAPDGRILLGKHKAHKQYIKAAIMRDGNTIGSVELGLHRPIEEIFDLNYIQTQQKNLWLLAGLILAVSALLAVLISPHLVRPLLELSAFSEQLRQQNYSTKISSRRRDELGELADNMDSLAQHLDAAQQSRRRWLANTSHELRTPLAILRGEIEALLDGIRKVDNRHLQSLLDEVQHLEYLIKDLQQISDMQSPELLYRLERMDLSAFITGHLEKQALLFSQTGLMLNVDIEPGLYIAADCQRLQQLLDNLASNSLKYTDAPGQVDVSLKQDDARVILSWQDSSPTVEKEDMPQLFEYLYRAEESRSRKTGGFGLGLSLVAAIAKAHDAELSASASNFGGLQIELRFKAVV